MEIWNPRFEHVQVGEEAMEKDVDVRKNLLLENSHDMVLAACWSTLEDIELWALFFQQTRRNIHSLLELGRTTICVIFQIFYVSNLLRRNGYLNLRLDILSLLCWDKKIVEEFNKSMLMITQQYIFLWTL
jgi:hypothetical protein